MKNNVKNFMPADVSPHAIMCHLQEHLKDIEGLYVIVKDKDGNFNESVCGNIGDLALVIMIWQKYWNDHI